MSIAGLRAVLDRFRAEAGRAEEVPTDGQLLTRFVTERDEAAFAELVARLGSVVFALCHRLLGDRHAAEDAFQATFVVLAREAQTVRPPEAVSGWVYGVARKAALEASVVKRRRRETLVADVPDTLAAPVRDRTCWRPFTRRWPRCPSRTGRPWCCVSSRAWRARKRPVSWAFRRAPCPADWPRRDRSWAPGCGRGASACRPPV